MVSMSPLVTTRMSLLLRIRDPRDSEAWMEFVRIYAPIIHRYNLRTGMQDADAADLTQEVLQVVSEAIQQFDYDSKVGRFRGWLKTVAFYTCSQMKRRQKRQPVGTGNTDSMRALDGPSKEADSRFWDEQYSRRIFEMAAERVRPTVNVSTWDAFMATAIQEEKPAVVAKRLGLSVGSVYVAKNRVFSRIRDQLHELDERS